MEDGQPNVATLSREQLYDKIWETPASKLSGEFGVSDVGLAKICKRHRIPRPPRGYWAKRAHGKRVRRASLPRLDDEALEEVRIFRNAFFGQDEESREDRPKRPAIEVPETLVAPHALIATTRKYLRSAKRGDDGRQHPDRKTCLDICVSPKSLGRALRVYDTFLKEWERMGGKLSVGEPNGSREFVTTVELHDDRVSIELAEETERYSTGKESSRHWAYRDWKYRPTGKLVFQVGGACWGCGRRRWADGKRQRVENLLGSLINGLVAILDSNRLTRLDNQCEGRQRARVHEVREAAKKRQQLEEQRRTGLSENVSAWRNANEIRAYLDALRHKIDAKELAPNEPEAFAEWLDWAAWYADSIDPLTPTPSRPEYIEPPKNTPIDELDLTRQTRPVVQQLAVTNTDELYAVQKNDVVKLDGQSHWHAWPEICRVLEGLGYDVEGRYHDWS